MKKNKRLTPAQAVYLGFDVKKPTKHGNPKYPLDEKQLQKLSELTNLRQTEFKEVKRTLDKTGAIVSTIEKRAQKKLIDIPENHTVKRLSTNVTTGQQWIITEPKKIEEEIQEIDFESIIKKYSKRYEFNFKPNDWKNFVFDRLVYTDVHIGMTPNENGFSLYGGKWDEEEINNRLEIIIKHVLENKKSDTLIIDDLGDFVDGWDGETVRRGHKLPQNMDNETAFDVAFSFKVKLIDALAPHYSNIICNCVCNDNHSGSFAYVINKPFKELTEHKYKHITVNVLRRFINHYTIGKNCFILTHGKDSKNLKFGFKAVLDENQSEKIDNYIKEHRLYDFIIEFSKGDSHQKIFDESTSDLFDYYNYPALSPSSEWVQTNFKKGMSGFEFFNFKEDGSKSHHPYKFKWVN